MEAPTVSVGHGLVLNPASQSRQIVIIGVLHPVETGLTAVDFIGGGIRRQIDGHGCRFKNNKLLGALTGSGPGGQNDGNHPGLLTTLGQICKPVLGQRQLLPAALGGDQRISWLADPILHHGGDRYCRGIFKGFPQMMTFSTGVGMAG